MSALSSKRYRLVCVAPEVPDLGSYDELDEAIVNSTAHFEVYDTEAGEYVPVDEETYYAARARLGSRGTALGDPAEPAPSDTPPAPPSDSQPHTHIHLGGA